jgi:hypothetical protein
MAEVTEQFVDGLSKDDDKIPSRRRQSLHQSSSRRLRPMPQRTDKWQSKLGGRKWRAPAIDFAQISRKSQTQRPASGPNDTHQWNNQ